MKISEGYNKIRRGIHIMKKIKTAPLFHNSSFIICFILLLLLTNTLIKNLNAAFEDITIGARAAGLAGAYSAFGEDGYSIYYNPSGLASIPRGVLSVQYSKLHIGLDDNSDLSNAYMSVAQPLKLNNMDFGTIGLGWLQFALAGYYQENTISIAWSRDIVANKFSMGLSAKLLSIKYGEDEYTANALDNEGKSTGISDPLFASGYSVNATDFDIGIRWPFARNYTVALVAQNIAGANISLGGKDTGALLEKRYRLGFAHTGKFYALTTDVVAIMPSDISSKNQVGTKTRLMIGAEKSFAFGGAVRGGMGIGSDGYANVAGGIGYSADGLSFDYGVILPLQGIKDTYGSHRVSVNLKFGPVLRHPESDSELKVRLAEEITARQEIEQKYRISEMELARAKEEIKQLKNQIEELLKRPAAALPSPKVIPTTQPTKPGEKATAVTPPTAAPTPTAVPAAAAPIPTDIDQIKAMYAKEFNQYQKDAAKLDLKKRIIIIDNIVTRYQGRIKITEALDEQMILKNELSAQTKFYNDALSYYRRLVRQGISDEERKDILKRMIAKYEPLGVDVTAAKEELSQVK